MKTNHFILNSYVPISFSGSFQLTMYSAVGCWLYANALWASEHRQHLSKVNFIDPLCQKSAGVELTYAFKTLAHLDQSPVFLTF